MRISDWSSDVCSSDLYCSITGFGQTGPYAPRAGYDFLIQGMGGLLSVTGEKAEFGGTPQKAGVALADIMTGMYSTIAILGALTQRDRSGAGQYITMGLLDEIGTAGCRERVCQDG